MKLANVREVVSPIVCLHIQGNLQSPFSFNNSSTRDFASSIERVGGVVGVTGNNVCVGKLVGVAVSVTFGVGVKSFDT